MSPTEATAAVVAAVAGYSPAEIEASGAIPDGLIRSLGSGGVFRMALPQADGGSARSAWVAAAEELGRFDAAVRTFVTVQSDLVIRSLAEQGGFPAELAALVAGDALGAFCLTEPDAGSDAAAVATAAVPSAIGWMLTGSKAWATNALRAQTAIAFAQTPTGRMGAFVVGLPTAGWNATRMDGLLGMRALETCDLRLDGVAASALGDPDRGWALAMRRVDDGRLGVAAGSVGLGAACLDAAIDFAHARRQFGKAIASFQLVQALAADIAVDVAAARALVQAAATVLDAGGRASTEISMAKLFATEAAERCATRALQVFGSQGYSSRHPVERYFRDARAATLYQGTSEIQRLIIGRALLGVNAIA